MKPRQKNLLCEADPIGVYQGGSHKVVLALPDDAFLPFGPEGLSAGDTAWVLTSAALVLFMTPGLAFFYGGLSRQ
jgi:hypothetical protein